MSFFHCGRSVGFYGQELYCFVGPYGLIIKNTPPLFSERLSYIRWLPLGFGYRARFIWRNPS